MKTKEKETRKEDVYKKFPSGARTLEKTVVNHGSSIRWLNGRRARKEKLVD